MGLLTRLQLRDKLRTGLGQRTDRPDTDLDIWINQGLSLVSQPEVRRHIELEAEFSIPLVAAANTYNIGKGVAPLSLAYNILGTKELTFFDTTTDPPPATVRQQDIKPRPNSWWSGRTLFSAAGGPRHYRRRGNMYEFSPVPAAVDAGKIVRATVWREPPPFNTGILGDNQTSPLLDYFDRAIVLAAQTIAEFELGYRELSVHTKQELQAYVNQKSDEGETDEDTDQRAELRHESPMQHP